MTITRDEKRRRIERCWNFCIWIRNKISRSCVRFQSCGQEQQQMDQVPPVDAHAGPGRAINECKELRKRTNIAMELVTEHPILFLDDPTTGLDLGTTTDIISVLRGMSKRGRTIIFSINQPQYSIFRFFDSLTLVASGKVMFHGPARDALEYFTSAGYKHESHDNPADFFLDIINGGFSDTEGECQEADAYKGLFERRYQVIEKLANMYAQSPLHSDTQAKLDQLLGEQKLEKSSAVVTTCVTPFWHQFRWITWRSFRNFRGFPRVTVIQAMIAVILAVIMSVTFRLPQNICNEVKTRAGLLFFLTGFECILSISAGELFIMDRNHFLHEHSSGYYRASSYFFGKLLADLIPRRLLPSIIYTLTTYVIAGLSLFSITFLAKFSWILYVNIPHYGFKALQHNEFLGQNFCPEHNTEEISRCQNYVMMYW
ncbi:ATP-binding cassette sub-family G member 3 [Apodemus speciosus]|uniref:ATP-binding cassette sub-family G member 3 n=1 Tax=Apodemus speciosus TaxID=105296 RepID=A0ABQ0ES88_APOSI